MSSKRVKRYLTAGVRKWIPADDDHEGCGFVSKLLVFGILFVQYGSYESIGVGLVISE